MTAHEKFLHRELAIKDKKIDELKDEIKSLRATLRQRSDRVIRLSKALNPKT